MLPEVTQLSEESVDLLLYCLSGILPNTKIPDLGDRRKGAIREALGMSISPSDLVCVKALSARSRQS